MNTFDLLVGTPNETKWSCSGTVNADDSCRRWGNNPKKWVQNIWMRQLWIILGLVFYIFYTLAYLVFHFCTHQKMLEFMDHMECYTHNPKKNLANQWIWPPGDSTLCRFFALEFAHGICTNQHLSCEIMIICYCYVSYVWLKLFLSIDPYFGTQLDPYQPFTPNICQPFRCEVWGL